MLSSDVGGKPETSHRVVTYHKVTLKKHIRNHSQKASGEKEVQKEPLPRSKWWARKQSQQQAEEQSQRQARQEQSQQQAKQTKLRRPRQSEVRGETQYRRKLQPAMQMPAGAMRADAWRSDHDYPKDQRGNRGVPEASANCL